MVEKAGINTLYKFDVITFAKDVLDEVDRIRSFNQVSDLETGESFNIPTESRLNAFFRLIGLPSFVSFKSALDKKDSSQGPLEGDKHLTPGYDKYLRRRLSAFDIKNSNKEYKEKSIERTLAARESQLLEAEQRVGSNDTNRAMTLAITNAFPLAPNVPADKDGAGTFSSGGTQRTAYKKLKPLITSHVEVFPRNNQLARPFLKDTAGQAKITAADAPLGKPFIETVARIRLIDIESSGNAATTKKHTDFQNSIKNTIGEDLFNKLFNDSAKIFQQANVLERFILDKLLSSVGQLAAKWIELRKRQDSIARQAAFRINIKTSSSKTSVFGKRAGVSSDVELLKGSDKGELLRLLNIQIAKDEALLSLMPTDDTAIPTESTAQTGNILQSALLTPFTNILNGDLENNKKRIKSVESDISRAAQEAEVLRLELEMMTGEFTGLSVPDVVAVIIGLFLISKKDLLTLLDGEILNNMALDPQLKSALESEGITPSGSTTLFDTDITAVFSAITNLEKQVDDVFSLLNAQVGARKNRDNAVRRTIRKGNKEVKDDTKTRTINYKDTAQKIADSVGDS